MIYTIKGRVISKKNNWHPIRRGNRTMIITSPRWKVFEKDAVSQLKEQQGTKKTIKSEVYIDYTFLMKGKGNSDTSNMITSIDDLLEKAGIIENDRLVTSGSFQRIIGQPEYITEIVIRELKHE